MAEHPGKHKDCRQFVADKFAAMGLDITVTTDRPLVHGPYTTEGFVCPHGVAFWPEPTGEQIAQWAKDGVT
jgi:adenosine deaminase